jgi:hypothetical protein
MSNIKTILDVIFVKDINIGGIGSGTGGKLLSSSVSSAAGSLLVGDDNSYGGAFTPASATVKGALSGIATAMNLLMASDFSNASGILGITEGGTGATTAFAATAALSVLTTKGDLWGYSTFNTRIPVGTNGFVLTADSTNPLGVSWATSSGTVSSISATVPSYMSVTGSPITSSGSLAFSFISQTPNLFFASPDGSSGAPGFRAIVANDIPVLNQNTTGSAGSVSGIVAIANGGTGQTTASDAFNALSPITALGDLIVGNGTNSATNLTIGTDGQILTAVSGTAVWAPATATGANVTLSNLVSPTAINQDLLPLSSGSFSPITIFANSSTTPGDTGPTTQGFAQPFIAGSTNLVTQVQWKLNVLGNTAGNLHVEIRDATINGTVLTSGSISESTLPLGAGYVTFPVTPALLTSGNTYYAVFWSDDDSSNNVVYYNLDSTDLEASANPGGIDPTGPWSGPLGAAASIKIMGVITAQNLGSVSNPWESAWITNIHTSAFQMNTSPTAGYVLTSDASGNGTWSPAPVTGANTTLSNLSGFTTGSIPFASGTSLIQDNANLFWDNTNKRLGIGTNTPAWPLDILSTQPYAINANVTSGDIVFRGTANGHSFDSGAIAAGGVFFGSETNDILTLRTNNTGRVVIDTAGLVKFNAYGAGTAVFDGSGNISSVAPSTSGNVLTSNGSTWVSSPAGGGGTPSDFIFTNSSNQSWRGPGPALLVDSVIAAGAFSYLGSSDVPVGNTTNDSVWVALQSGFILEHTSSHSSQDVEILSGFNYGTGNTGGVRLFSGDVSNSAGTGSTGIVRVYTGNTNSTTGDSGRLDVFTGNSTNGNSGDVNISTGTAGGVRGKVIINAHIDSQGSAPTTTVNANAGTGATSSVANATDTAGTVNLTLGSIGTLASGVQTTVNFNQSYAVAPIVVITPTNAITASNVAVFGVYVASSTSGFTINFATAGVATDVLQWNYFVIETQ